MIYDQSIEKLYHPENFSPIFEEDEDRDFTEDDDCDEDFDEEECDSQETIYDKVFSEVM